MISGVPAGARAIAVIIVGAVVIFMLVPLAVVVLSSFSASQFLVFPPRGLSLHWYGAVFGDQAYVAAGWTSLKLAILVTALATLVGTPAAIALTWHRLPGREILAGLFLSPLVLPTLIFGLGLLMVYSIYGNGPSFSGLVVGHLVICIPFVIRTVGAVLGASDPSLHEAARTMGANRLQAYWHVVLPQARPGIAAGAFFAFNISFDDAVVALFLRAPGMETLPIRIYSQLEFSPDPSVAAVSTIMIVITIGLVVLIDRFLGLRRVV